MTWKWIKRRAHKRALESGGETPVVSHWALVATAGEPARRTPFTSACPECGAEIRTVPMPNGGWIHVEPDVRHARVKHPCLYRGDDVRRGVDAKTGDLFR